MIVGGESIEVREDNNISIIDNTSYTRHQLKNIDLFKNPITETYGLYKIEKKQEDDTDRTFKSS